ncbi:protein C1orf43 homolog, partial [Egretta garzetta]|uniref:protein C1orf43 homolog n=1 Tax=Egretta garzetta TaxID=188379 RepID=UPI00163B9C86
PPLPPLTVCQSEATRDTVRCLSHYNRSFPWDRVALLVSWWLSHRNVTIWRAETRRCLCTALLSAFPTSLPLPSFAELSVWVFSLPGCYNYLYRMKALDAIRTSEIPFHAEGRYPKSLIGKNFCAYLLELRNSSTSFKGIRKALIDTLLDGYESARYGTGVFGKPEYLQYQDALNELANIQRRCPEGRSASCWTDGHDGCAAPLGRAELTLSPEVSNPATIQVTYLPSNQKSKRAKHFLELKSFKDNYNTLESTL